MFKTPTEKIYSYSTAAKILPHYEACIIDLWGVVHDGFQAYPGVVDCLNTLMAEKKPIIFLSNAPRPGNAILKKLLELGINATREMILSSGDAVRYQLEHREDNYFKQLGARLFHLGANRNSDILAGLKVDVTEDLEKAHFVLLTAFSEEDEDLNQWDPILKKAFELQLPLVCANPDTLVIHGNSKRYCSGIYAEKYEKMGGIVYYYGKPHAPILELTLKKLQDKGITNKKHILMIGDTLETDILSGKVMGTDSALVLTGNMSVKLKERNVKNISQSESAFLTDLFQRAHVTPTWVIPGLFF